MSESSLSIGLPELSQAVGFYLGYGRGQDVSWTATQLAEILGVVQSGVRRVYYPPAVDAGTVGYEWSWLRPNEYLNIYGRYNVGTIAIVSGVVTLTGGVWPSWAASGYLTATTVSQQGAVASRDSDTQITLVDTTVNLVSGSAYSIGKIAYDLPDNFGRLIGTLHYPEAAYRHTIQIVPASRIVDMYAYSNLTDDPTYAAVRYKADDGSYGQRQELLLFPTPTAPWTLSYEYEAYSGALSDDFPYPLGGMQLAELYIESCLALAETRINDAIGQHAQQFSVLLIDAVARDRKRGAQRYGAMGHKERGDGDRDWLLHGMTGPPYPIMYHGEMI